MAVNISAWSIRHPLPPIVMAAAIVALDFISFSKLPITRMPNVDAPVISVTIAQFGAARPSLNRRSPRRSRTPFRASRARITSRRTITDGISNTTIVFRLETNTDRAINDVKDAVTRARADLPRGIDEPLVQRVDIAGLPILTYAAIAPGKTPEQLSWFVEDVVVRGCRACAASAASSASAAWSAKSASASIRSACKRSALTPLDVSRQLRGSNVDLAGGRAEIGGRDQAIRTLAGAKTLPDLRGDAHRAADAAAR